MSIRRKRLVGGLLVAAVLATVGVLVARFAGAQEDPQVTHNPLITTNRTHLSICVDGARGYAVSQQEVTWLREALDDALNNSPLTPPEFAQRELVTGCPSPPAALTEDNPNFHELWQALVHGVGWPVVDTPSPHLVFVYLVPPEFYESKFDIPYLVGNADRTCEVDTCVPLTVALYLSPAIESQMLREALLDSLGLLPYRPEPTIDWRPCELGTPEPYCVRYDDYKAGEFDTNY